MTMVKLIYNPYTLKTDLLVETQSGEVAFTKDSSVAFIFGKFMNKWLEPINSWKGFFAELADAVGDDNLKIHFVGTAEDFKDLTAEATFAEQRCRLSIEIEHLFSGITLNETDAQKKLHDLPNFLNASNTAVGKNFFADIRHAFEKISSEKIKVKVISTVKNFPAQNIFSKVVENPNLELVINESNQNLTSSLLNAFAEVDRSVILFVFNRETISSSAVHEALRNVTYAVGQDEYAQTICESLFFVCTDCEEINVPLSVRQIKNILGSCGFEEPKLFMIGSEFADLLLTNNFEQENFASFQKTLSATDCKNFLHVPIHSTLRTHYEAKIESYRKILEKCASFLKYYGLHSPGEIENVKNQRNDALNEIALINSNIPALEQTILTYAERFVLPMTVRKIYLGLKKKIAVAEREFEQKISDTEESLQSLRGRISEFNQPVKQKNLYEKFLDEVVAVHFDNSKYEQLLHTLLDRVATFKVPEIEVVDKNIVGHTETYVKLAKAQSHSQFLNDSLKQLLTELVKEIAKYFTECLVMPLRDAVAQLKADDQIPFKKLTADFEKIIGDENFGVSTMNFESFAVSSYEKNARGRFGLVEYVSVSDIVISYREQGNRLLKERLHKLKTAAQKFVSDFQSQAEMIFQNSTPNQGNVNRELQQLRQGISSKEQRLAGYKRELKVLKNFPEKIDRLFEMNP